MCRLERTSFLHLLWQYQGISDCQKTPQLSRTSKASGYPFRYLDALVGGPPTPRTGRFTPGRTRLTAWFFRSLRSLISAHPRRKVTAQNAPPEVRQRRRSLLMSDMPGNRADHNDLQAHLPGIIYCCAGADSPHSVIDSQQQSGRIHQPMVPVDHAAIIVIAAHIVNRIGLFQNRVIPLPC